MVEKAFCYQFFAASAQLNWISHIFWLKPLKPVFCDLKSKFALILKIKYQWFNGNGRPLDLYNLLSLLSNFTFIVFIALSIFGHCILSLFFMVILFVILFSSFIVIIIKLLFLLPFLKFSFCYLFYNHSRYHGAEENHSAYICIRNCDTRVSGKFGGISLVA
jgi:hypothetical protein